MIGREAKSGTRDESRTLLGGGVETLGDTNTEAHYFFELMNTLIEYISERQRRCWHRRSMRKNFKFNDFVGLFNEITLALISSSLLGRERYNCSILYSLDQKE